MLMNMGMMRLMRMRQTQYYIILNDVYKLFKPELIMPQYLQLINLPRVIFLGNYIFLQKTQE